MPKTLIIVESPTKTRTLKSFLGPEYRAEASMGHVRDLPEREIGVDVANGFAASYVNIDKKRNVLSRLSEAAREADRVFLAPDPDREGEAIAWHLSAALKLSNAQRIQFNEYTRSAVIAALDHPRPIDEKRVDAQEARRILDRLVGYRLSPLLWKKVRKGLSAGRVQSVAVRLICDREREIQAFVPVEYWSLTAKLTPVEPEPRYPFEAKLVQRHGQKIELGSQADADSVLRDLRNARYEVASVKTHEKSRNPAPPFITSTLQQEAARKLGFSNKRTMSTAQQLYEGIDTGPGGAVGLITYMRTDSPRVAAEAQNDARAYIAATYGEQYAPERAAQHKAKGAAQDAHEAIRPTGVERTPDVMASHLTSDQLRLYRLIWQRFLASQMRPARFDVTTADIGAVGYTFRATGSVLRFDGFMRVYTEGRDTDERPDEERDPLPPLSAGQPLDLLDLAPKQHFTEPPPRYSEATLVKVLEEKGIGRPSTYATIIATIQDRGYVQLEERKFRPTELGFTVNDLLVRHFPEIMDVGFTAGMETHLDDIADGKYDKVALLTEFYGPFSDRIDAAHVNMERLKPEQIETDHVCPKCGKKMMLRQSDRGPFLGCSGYPRCKAVLNADGTPQPEPEEAMPCPKCGKKLVRRESDRGPFLGCSGYPRCRTVLNLDGSTPEHQDKPPAATPTDQKCPKCGKDLVERSGRYGKFLGCSGYPECRTIVRAAGQVGGEKTEAAPAQPTGVACPQDGGSIVEKRSRRGATFYGCANYPKCKFVTWHRPTGDACPQCSWPLGAVSYRGKPTGAVKCTNEECSHEARLAE